MFSRSSNTKLNFIYPMFWRIKQCAYHRVGEQLYTATFNSIPSLLGDGIDCHDNMNAYQPHVRCSYLTLCPNHRIEVDTSNRVEENDIVNILYSVNI